MDRQPTSDKRDSRPVRTIGAGFVIGLGAGVAIGVALGNIALGIPIGIGAGLLMGAALEQRKRRESEGGEQPEE